MTLIDRLRTGTHEQAVGLLRECYKAIFPPRNTLPQGSSARDAAYWRDENFNALLGIGTPEACVGAAMMLVPEGATLNLIWNMTDAGKSLQVVAIVTDDEDFIDKEASTLALSMAAAIMETRNA